MAFPRAYIPSRALLRALSRPQPPPCPFSRPLNKPFLRGKRTRAARVDKPDFTLKDQREAYETIKNFQANMSDEEWVENAMKPPSDEDLETKDYPTINWYEQDLHKGTPPRLISRLATKEDRKRHKETYNMMEESYNNPDYDPAELNRRMMDSLIQDPNFADLTEQLMEIKQNIKSKEELAELSKKAEEEAKEDHEHFKREMKEELINAVRELRDDPEFADVKPELENVLANIPEFDNPTDPKFMEALVPLEAKIKNHEAFHRKMREKFGDVSLEDMQKEAMEHEARVNELLTPVDPNHNDWEDLEYEEDDKVPEEVEDLEKLLTQMNDVLKYTSGDSTVEADLQKLLNEDPYAKQPGEYNREMDMDELAVELKKLIETQPEPQPEWKPEEEEHIPADLQAKVDQIMKDPKLMEKLLFIQKVIVETEREKTDITTINHETAPDPYKLDETHVTTLKHRAQIARADPEHLAAMRQLNVRLKPPFNISPALKSFNEAIELAYIGANDDVRRVLWRAYQKVRLLPTFLQNLSDEAWDILYYSQAVTWGYNQNRQAHLRTILADLKTVGREGPPTHPRTLIGNRLEDDLAAV